MRTVMRRAVGGRRADAVRDEAAGMVIIAALQVHCLPRSPRAMAAAVQRRPHGGGASRRFGITALRGPATERRVQRRVHSRTGRRSILTAIVGALALAGACTTSGAPDVATSGAPAGAQDTQGTPAARPDDAMNAVAESYVRLVLALGTHDADYVDAYYGPPAWRAEAEAAKPP